MSLGLDPPQTAARGPHPSSPGAFAVDGRREGNKRGGGWSGLRCLVNPAFSLILLLSDPATAVGGPGISCLWLRFSTWEAGDKIVFFPVKEIRSSFCWVGLSEGVLTEPFFSLPHPAFL